MRTVLATVRRKSHALFLAAMIGASLALGGVTTAGAQPESNCSPNAPVPYLGGLGVRADGDVTCTGSTSVNIVVCIERLYDAILFTFWDERSCDGDSGGTSASSSASTICQPGNHTWGNRVRWAAVFGAGQQNGEALSSVDKFC